MTKSALKTGMIVTLRRGDRCIVFREIDFYYGTKDSGAYHCLIWLNSTRSWNGLRHYKEDLTYTGCSGEAYDIVKVEQIEHPSDLPLVFKDISRLKDSLKTIWQREEIKEVTMAEVEEKFGCKVKIIKE